MLESFYYAITCGVGILLGCIITLGSDLQFSFIIEGETKSESRIRLLVSAITWLLGLSIVFMMGVLFWTEVFRLMIEGY